jgi:hypothetical protein
MTLDRRRFLQLTAAGLVASLTESACAGGNNDAAAGAAQPPLLEVLGPERAKEIGAQYRAAYPKENSVAVLRDAVSHSQHNDFPWIRRRLVDDVIREDFEHGRIVIVNGWVLSETEARLCALYSLTG